MDRNTIIRQARNQAGLHQKELADRVGCSQQTVVDIESGRIQRSKFLADICQELGLDYRALMSGASHSQAQVTARDFGTPLPVVASREVAGWIAGNLDVSGQREYLPCPVPHSDRSFVVRASGDAMEPDIRHLDWVHVDPGQNWTSGDIVCIFVNSTAAPMFRRLFSEGADYYIVAERDKSRQSVKMVDALDQVETSALALLEGSAVAYVAGKAIFAGRFY